MISRVAENCFWLFRYMERVESIARLFTVNRAITLDLEGADLVRWRPLIIVSGEEKRFDARYSGDESEDAAIVENYLVWDEENPVSILSSTRFARENARMVREVITAGMWEALNEFWHWLSQGAGWREFNKDGDAFYRRVIETCHLFLGVSHNTLIHDTPFDFMRLGMLIERAGQTARLVDVKHQSLGSLRGDMQRPEEAAQWTALLQSIGAADVFLKRFGGVLDNRSIVEFLVLEEAFPRSIHHCIDRSVLFLKRMKPRGHHEIGATSLKLVESLRDRLRAVSVDAILETGLHRELTRIIDGLAEACVALQKDYFDMQVRRPKSSVRRRRKKEQSA